MPLDFIYKQFAFDSIKECMDFLEKVGVIFTRDRLSIDCKESAPILQQAQRKNKAAWAQ